MATLVVTGTTDFSSVALSNIDLIDFATFAQDATATFSYAQFNNLAILDNVRIDGSTSSVFYTLRVIGGSVDASGWTFTTWKAPLGVILLEGSSGNDAIVGSQTRDHIYGGDGNDLLEGGGGPDVIFGTGGNDSLYGGGAADMLSGDGGDDVLYGDGGNDRLYGSTGDDNCFGGDGDDRFLVYGADFGDNVDGGAGIDVLYLRDWRIPGVGFLVNMPGLVYAPQPNTSGADGIYSITGVEHVHGSNAKDTIIGDSGNNILVGGGGRDEMSGGLGNDTFYVDTIGDTVFEYSGQGFDTIFSQSGLTVPHYVERVFLLNGGNYNVSGRVGKNDMIIGNDGANIINGLSANDTLNGGLGNDTLSGGLGSDVFQFRTAPDSATNKDVITDFNVANDTIQMDSAVYLLLGAKGAMAAALFKNLSLGAQDADDRILYDTNGLTAGGGIHFAEVTDGLALTAADFVVV